MARPLGRDHKHVHVLGGFDLAEVDIEAVGEQQGLAGPQMGLDIPFVHGSLMFVRQQDHDHVGLFGGLGGGKGLEAVLLGKLVIGTAGALADDDVDARIAQILRMGMALAAVTEDGHGLALEHVEVGVLFVIGFHEDPPKM